MSKIRTVIVATVIAFGTITSSVHAETFDQGATVTDGVVYAAVAQADAYWTSQGYVMPDVKIVSYSTPAVAGEQASADMPGTKIGFVRSYLAEVRSQMSRGFGQLPWLIQLCVISVHERGHNLGFAHSTDPMNVMYPTAAHGPEVCETWAQNVISTTRRKIRAAFAKMHPGRKLKPASPHT